MPKLEKPRGLTINFKPSERQYELWRALQPGVCECGGKLEMRPNGFDSHGHQIYKATCTKCGTTDIPEQILGGGSAGGGKALSLDSEVVTPEGVKRYGDLKVGDSIISAESGESTEVIALHPIETRDYYRLHFEDGTFVDCSDNHIWSGFWVKKKSERHPNPGCFDSDNEMLQILTHHLYYWYNKESNLHKLGDFMVPLSAPVQFSPTDNKNLHPYIVGALLGSGDISELNLEHYPLITHPKEKSIPIQYKQGTIDERKKLIQGLLDIAGFEIQEGMAVFSTTSAKLAEDFAFVIRSLGGMATICVKQQDETLYDVSFKINNFSDFVCCERNKLKAAETRFFGEGKRVLRIEYLGKKEGRCITIKDKMGLFLTNNFTVTHNSYLGCAWLVLSCMQYDGIRMVVARKERKTLIDTTWRTLNDVLQQWGLKRDIHYKVDNLRYAITFWNGSEILALHLTPSPNDPDFNSLGSLEITSCFIDEVSEVSEKAVEVLSSRVRYKVAETFVVGKTFMSTNPCLGWVRDTFVMDENHEPVKLQTGYRYIPFSLFDNPNEKFRNIYYNKLSKLRNKADRDRLLFGNWEFTEKNTQAAYWNFDGEKHLVMNLKEMYYDPLKPLILSWDFNGAPYMSCLPMQISFEDKKIYIFPEYIGYPKDKLNNTPDMSKWVCQQLIKQNHVGGVLITGDPAGLARSTQTAEGTNNYTIINKSMTSAGLRPKIQLLNKQPSHVVRLEFVNELLKGYSGWQILIDARCHKLIEDFSYQKKNPDGTKEKKKVLNESGMRVEKWGHFSDCFDYAMVYYLNQEYVKFKTAGIDLVTTVGNDEIVYGDFEY